MLALEDVVPSVLKAETQSNGGVHIQMKSNLIVDAFTLIFWIVLSIIKWKIIISHLKDQELVYYRLKIYALFSPFKLSFWMIIT